MCNAGLLWKYKVNGRLTDEERELQLKQQQSLDSISKCNTPPSTGARRSAERSRRRSAP
jgi:hypothetical protein